MFKVERRVVNKLASAHERGLFSQGAKVRVFTNLPDDSSTNIDANRSSATIELEVIDKGGEKNRISDSSVLDSIKKIFV